MKNNLPPSFNTQTMSEANVVFSLCSNCMNLADCSFQKDRKTPVFYCEEFEMDVRDSEGQTENQTILSHHQVDVDEDDSTQFIGLCSNCNNRSICVFPKHEGGIWHCEEYQ